MHVALTVIKTTQAVVEEGSLYGLTHCLLLNSVWPRRHGDQKLVLVGEICMKML